MAGYDAQARAKVRAVYDQRSAAVKELNTSSSSAQADTSGQLAVRVGKPIDLRTAKTPAGPVASTQGASLAMSSQEIADLVESRHDKVKQSIERLAERGVIQLPPLGEKSRSQGRPGTEYVFAGVKGKRDSLIVVAQLSPEFTARLVDRWQELEDQVAKPAPVASLNDPATLRGLLLGYTEQVFELQHKVAEDAPKVETYNNIVSAKGNQTMQSVAKQLGVGEKKLFALLREEGILQSNAEGWNEPYQKHLDAGHFHVKTTEFFVPATKELKIKSRTFVTGKGLTYLERRLNKLGYYRKEAA